MKKTYKQLLTAFGVSTLIFGTIAALADSQGGNTVGPVLQQNGQTLNTQVVPAKLTQIQLIQNLGISGFGIYTTPQQSGTALQATSTNANVSGYVCPTVLSTNPGLSAVTGTGSIVVTGSGIEIYISSTSGLVITSGTVRAVSGTAFNF